MLEALLWKGSTFVSGKTAGCDESFPAEVDIFAALIYSSHPWDYRLQGCLVQFDTLEKWLEIIIAISPVLFKALP